MNSKVGGTCGWRREERQPAGNGSGGGKEVQRWRLAGDRQVRRWREEAEKVIALARQRRDPIKGEANACEKNNCFMTCNHWGYCCLSSVKNRTSS